MPAWNPQANDIFLDALEIAAPADRRTFIERACAGDTELQGQVVSLLEASQKAGSFLEIPPSAVAVQADATIDQPISEKPGTIIGPYKLLQKIGEGGFGVVFMADQTEPVKRRVALKIIKPGMDTRQVIARFEAERQALAMMDHPNIAKVLGAGTTESGRPYFVMELIKGVPITQYCDEKQLATRERLELFLPVCQALQHAHQKGIIHRDIKPSNVLVAKYDDRPVPKVIDFGVVKAIEQHLTEKTMFTQFGQIVGTVDYMSPEQANLNQFDIDTRSDIYSLGVLLYELLTGETPFDRQRLRSAAFDELLRIIREEEPPKPSLRLSTSEFLPSIAANRQIEPKKLSTLVRGELDWIVMKALEKDRTRRYETANGFANDIQRYLNDEAVMACPPSWAYRFRKFARRNKVAIATTVMVVAALVVGIVGTTWQAVRATKERNRAVTAEQLAQDEAERANREAAIARAVNKFLNRDLLSEADPKNEPDRDIKLRTVVERAAERIEGRFADQPLVEAAVRTTLGNTYLGLGEHGKAQQHYERARKLRQRELGPEHPRTLDSMNNLATAIGHQGRYAEAEKLNREVLEICKRVLGPEHPRTLGSMNNLAAVMNNQGRYAEAEKLNREVLEIRQRVLGPEHPQTLDSTHNLALAMKDPQQHVEAEKLNREVLEIRQRVLGPEHPDTLKSMNNLATAMKDQQQHAEAEKLNREVLEIRQRVLGPEHPVTLKSMNNVAAAIGNQGRYTEAEKLNREVLEIRERVLRPEHPDTLKSMNNVAAAIGNQGRYAEAEKLNREVLEIRERVLRPEHPDTLKSMNNLATVIGNQGRYVEAEKLNREVLEIRERVLGPEHPQTLNSMHNLAILYTNWCWKLATAADVSERNPAKAVELANLAIELQPDVANHWSNLGVAQYRAGHWQAAVEALEKADAMLEEGDRVHCMFLAMARWQLGDKEKARELYAQGAAWIAAHRKNDEGQNRFRAEAEQLMEITEEDRKRLVEEYHARQVENQPDVAQAWIDRANWHQQQGAYDKAIEDYGQIIKLRPDDAQAWSQRAQAYSDLRQWDQAIKDYGQAIKLRPDDAVLYVHRSKAHRVSGHYNEALQDASTGLLAAPDDARLLGERALAYVQLKQWDKAFADYNEAIRLAPEVAAWYRDRGKAYLRLGRYAEALADFNRFVELRPDKATAALSRAQLLLLTDRTGEYRQACIAILDRFAHSEEFCHAARACVLAPEATPDPMRAVELATRAVSRNPSESTLYTLGMAHLRAGQLDEAAQCIRQSLSAEPNWDAIFLNWLGLALVQHERGETQEARQWLGKAVESMEQHPAPALWERTEGQLLRREVEQLLGKTEQENDTAKGEQEK